MFYNLPASNLSLEALFLIIIVLMFELSPCSMRYKNKKHWRYTNSSHCLSLVHIDANVNFIFTITILLLTRVLDQNKQGTISSCLIPVVLKRWVAPSIWRMLLTQRQILWIKKNKNKLNNLWYLIIICKLWIVDYQ